MAIFPESHQCAGPLSSTPPTSSAATPSGVHSRRADVVARLPEAPLQEIGPDLRPGGRTRDRDDQRKAEFAAQLAGRDHARPGSSCRSGADAAR